MSRTKSAEKKSKDDQVNIKGECFVIMPISDPDGYEEGHFKHVYQDIFVPAIKAAGYTAKRADDVRAANMIHLDIIERLVSAPMAICDLSSRNPNVLFELGFRQAFDMPTVLVQEKGTKRIFDINGIRTEEYASDLKYRQVLSAQKNITDIILETEHASKDGSGANSLVSLLEMSAAKIEPGAKLDADEAMNLIRSEIEELKTGMRQLISKASDKVPNESWRTYFRNNFPAADWPMRIHRNKYLSHKDFLGVLDFVGGTEDFYSGHPMLPVLHELYWRLDMQVGTENEYPELNDDLHLIRQYLAIGAAPL